VKSSIVLGDSGFIGSAFLKKLKQSNEKVVGINRQRILVCEDQITREFPRKSSKLSIEILPFLAKGAVVINAAWGRNDRGDRDSPIHAEYAKDEVLLIDAVKRTGCHYISFGSIAEIDDGSISPSRKTAYATAKKLVADHLAKSGLKFNWLRVASLYGPDDKREWLLPRLLHSLQTGEEVVLENPAQQINLCHIDSLVVATLTLVENGIQGTFNVTTDQWLTVSALKKCFADLIEPEYLPHLSGSFSRIDPIGLQVETPALSDFFTTQKQNHKS